MTSPEKIKFAKKLHLKKYRQKYGQFLVEGQKVVAEFMNASWSFDVLYVKVGYEYSEFNNIKCPIIECSEKDMARISYHKTAPPIIGIVKVLNSINMSNVESTLVLDRVNNPGNLGTLIRLADWFGLKQVVVSEETTDPFSPKVIASSMGSSARVKVVSTAIDSFIDSFNGDVFVGHLQGKKLTELEPTNKPFVLVMGSESHGVAKEILDLSRVIPITISKKGNAESLNIAVAAGILLNKLVDG